MQTPKSKPQRNVFLAMPLIIVGLQGHIISGQRLIRLFWPSENNKNSFPAVKTGENICTITNVSAELRVSPF